MRARYNTLDVMGRVMKRCFEQGEDAVLKLHDKLNEMRHQAQQDARIARVQADGADDPMAGLDAAGQSDYEDLFGVPLVAEAVTEPVAEFETWSELQRARDRAESEDREPNTFESLDVADAQMRVVDNVQRYANDVLDGYQEGDLERALRELAEEGDVFADIVNEVLAVQAENPTIPLLLEAQPPSLPPSPPAPSIGRSAVVVIPTELELPPSVLEDTKDPKGPLENADQALDWMVEKLRAKTRTPEESEAWMLEIAEQRGKEAAAQWDGVIAQLEAQRVVFQSYVSALVQTMRAQEAEEKKLQRAVAHVRAYLLHPEWVDGDPEAVVRKTQEEHEQLARLNDALRLVPYTDNGMSSNEYRERIRGIGIDDPEACNDGNVDEIDPRELHGWKGQYRRHVATMIRVRPAGGPPAGRGMCYYLDLLPPTPRQWLESTDAQRAPGPPRIPNRNPKAEADAALLQATSLSQGVKAIVGPEEQWGGKASGYAEELACTEKTLKALLLADRAFLTDPQRSLYAPFAFDFDGVEPSSVIHA